MSCPSTCENPPEATGGIGVCDNITGLCICPPGFDGKDIWKSFNDCHVNQSLRTDFLLGTLVVNAIAAIVSFVVLTRLGYHYLRSFRCSKEQGFDEWCSSNCEKPAGDVVGKESTETEDYCTYYCSICWMCLCSALLCFHIVLTFRYELRYALDLCLAVFHICIFSSYWLSVYVWFKLLPSLPFLAKLYRMKTFVFDRPDMVPRLVKANIATIVVVELLFTFIFPSIFFDDAELRDIFDTVGIIAKMFYCISLCIPVIFFIRAITRLLGQSVYQMKNLKPEDLGFIGKGRNSVRAIRATLFFLTLTWIGLFIPALAIEYGQRNRFAFYSPASCAVLVGVISTSINVGIRMAETVDLAAAVSDQRSEDSDGNNDRKPSSKLDRQSLKLLLMDDETLQEHV